jgi:integrase
LLLALEWNTGLRTSDLVSVSRRELVLTPECPIPGWDHVSPHGWIWLRAGKTRKETFIPLHQTTRQHIDQWIAHYDPSGTLLPLGLPSEQSAADEKRRQAALQAINYHAGIVPGLQLQHLRKGANQAFNLAQPGAGPALLQHSAKGVNEQYYSNGLPLLLQAVAKIQCPFEFPGQAK